MKRLTNTANGKPEKGQWKQVNTNESCRRRQCSVQWAVWTWGPTTAMQVVLPALLWSFTQLDIIILVSVACLLAGCLSERTGETFLSQAGDNACLI